MNARTPSNLRVIAVASAFTVGSLALSLLIFGTGKLTVSTAAHRAATTRRTSRRCRSATAR